MYNCGIKHLTDDYWTDLKNPFNLTPASVMSDLWWPLRPHGVTFLTLGVGWVVSLEYVITERDSRGGGSLWKRALCARLLCNYETSQTLGCAGTPVSFITCAHYLYYCVVYPEAGYPLIYPLNWIVEPRVINQPNVSNVIKELNWRWQKRHFFGRYDIWFKVRYALM